MIKEVIQTFRFLTRIEFKSPFVLGSNLVFIITTVFIASKIFSNFSIGSVVGVFWLSILFIATNTILNSFRNETGQSAIFFYTLLDPISLLIAKILFNFSVLLVSFILLFLCISIFLTNPIQDIPLFIQTMLLVTLGLSINLSFLSSIAIHSSQNFTLLVLLSFPTLIPIILLGLQLSMTATGMFFNNNVSGDLLLLVAMDIILLGLSLILFPNIWRS